MSGYNKKTGEFSLTLTQARYWLRRKDMAHVDKAETTIEFFADLLRDAGLTVAHVDNAFLRVKATQGTIWEVLSGSPSDPDREAHHVR